MPGVWLLNKFGHSLLPVVINKLGIDCTARGTEDQLGQTQSSLGDQSGKSESQFAGE